MSEPKMIPSQFVAQSNIISSYDYIDVAEGTGYTTFYGLAMRTFSGLTYSLSTLQMKGAVGNVHYGEDMDSTEESRIKQSGTTGDYVEVGELDFDLSMFNIAKTIKGTALIEYSMACIETDASRSKGYWKFNIIKDHAGTETVIGSANSEVTDSRGTGLFPPSKLTGCLPITCTQTHFEKGDILRITAEAWLYYISEGTNTYLHLAHSPLNYDTTNFTATTNPTSFKVRIPFRIET